MDGLRSLLRRFVRLMRNGWFWSFLGLLVLFGAALYGVVDQLLMPQYTRFGVQVEVPDVMQLESDAAQALLASRGLVTEEQILRKPNLPRNVVIDQRPPAGALVKPGRRVYVTINTGDTSTVAIPRLTGFSVREAQNRITVHGLVVASARTDSVPSSHPNTVTRQDPPAGRRVPMGSGVTIWYSTGLGSEFVVVPDVVGLAADEAGSRLLAGRLRSVVLGAGGRTSSETVLEQSPEAGTTVREGFEVRLRVTRPDG